MNNQSNTRTQDPQYRERFRDRVDLDAIVIPATHRAIDPKKVEELAQSMANLGLIHPIVVLEIKDDDTITGAEVVAGGHRVEAARSLEWDFIDATWVHDRAEARLITISENIHRNELSALERDEQIAEWIELTEHKQVSSQVGTKPQGGRPEGGVRAAARVLGIGKNDAHRAVKVASLSSEAKDEARALGLDDNRSALLDAAKHQNPEDQIAALIAAHGPRVVTNAATVIRARETQERHAKRIAKIANISAGNTAIGTEQKFPIILADPPWNFHLWSPDGDGRAADQHYPTMALEDICKLPVSELATDDAVLFMWTTAPHLVESIEVLKAWGFEYVTNIAWVKDKIGLGYWVRNQHELLLICRRGDIPAPLPANRPPSVIEAPRREHSRKPDEAYELIERMYPGLPKIELFARQARPGWACWGNQAPAGS